MIQNRLKSSFGNSFFDMALRIIFFAPVDVDIQVDIDVNIYDIEIAHSSEGQKGVVIMVVPLEKSERLMGGLMANGYRPSVRAMDS